MATELIINASLPEIRIAMMEEGEIQDVLIERAQTKGITGNIYKGKVTRVLPGMQAAFVDIGLEKAAFLYVDDVYAHSEIWEDEGSSNDAEPNIQAVTESGPGEGSVPQVSQASRGPGIIIKSSAATLAAGASEASYGLESSETSPESSENAETTLAEEDSASQDEEVARELAEDNDPENEGEDEGDDEDSAEDADEDGDEDDDSPVGMCPGSDDSGHGQGDDENAGNRVPEGTIAPPSQTLGQPAEASTRDSETDQADQESGAAAGVGPKIIQREGAGGAGSDGGRPRRGRRGGKVKRGTPRGDRYRSPESGPGDQNLGTDVVGADASAEPISEHHPDNVQSHLYEEGFTNSDRLNMENSPVQTEDNSQHRESRLRVAKSGFQQTRTRDRKVRPRNSVRQPRAQVSIQDLLHEGQEVLVQVAKDPIATKGARLTCHISLPGRHLVCMPTIDHVGVSRRIESDSERRRLRDFVERNRPKNLGFIVRTASGKQSSAEKRLKQDVDYLAKLWEEIKEKAATVQAPALVYEDLTSVLRAIRDWVTEDIDKVIVDSRYHYNEILRFVSNFMPSLRQKVDLYHGDIPIFDAYNISTELSRALERKVWLKSGGYIVIDQAEAMVAIDVNTGRFVGKKNLEDTILKTNLEAAVEIAYQLRLRNCGGIIMLDFIDMEKEESRQRVYRAFEEALKRDRARPSIMKISDLGLVEMTRKRTRDTIIRTLCEPCLHCEGKGFIKSKQTVAYEALRQLERHGIMKETTKMLVQAHPDVIDVLALDEREILDILERKFRKQIFLQAIGDFHPEQFEVTPDKEPSAERIMGYDRSVRERRERNERADRNERDRSKRSRAGGRKNSGGGRDGYEAISADAAGDSADYSQGPIPLITPVKIITRNPNAQTEGPQDGQPGEQQVGQFDGELSQQGSQPLEASSEAGTQPSQGAGLGFIVTGARRPQPSAGGNAGGQGRYGQNRNRKNRDRGPRRFDRNGPVQGGQFEEGSDQGGVEPGNQRQSSSGEFSQDGSGYSEQNDNLGQMPRGPVIASRPRVAGDEDYSEEDRLAFLRAQAAQDAAIAKLGLAGDAAGSSNVGSRPPRNDRHQRGGRRPGQGGPGGKTGGRFQGGGKFSRGGRDQRRTWGARGPNSGTGGAEPGDSQAAAAFSPPSEGTGSGGNQDGGSNSGTPQNQE